MTESAVGQLELHGVSAGYREHIVISEIDLMVAAGQVTSVIGRNGCGKTTLLRTMAGQLPTSSGNILIDGRAIASYGSRALARHISYLPQARSTTPISVQTLVEHGRFPHLSFPRRLTPRDHDMVASSMQSAGVWELRRQPLNMLSGGERQKAWIAMALAQDAGIILLDEPATWLDVGSQRAVYQLAASLRERGKTVVMVVHDLTAALTWSDNICLMEGGRIAQHGPAADICASGEIDRVFQVHCERWLSPDGCVRYAVT